VTQPRASVAVVGIGLVGGSLLRRLTAEGVVVVGYDADPATRAVARTAGARAERPGWTVAGSLGEAVHDVDLVVLAVPLPTLAEVLAALARCGYEGLLTDVTSVKVTPAALAREHCPRARWLGGHPMAGTERSGFEASTQGLFDGAAWVLCVERHTPSADVLAVVRLATTVGARVVPATAEEHDRAVARASHLPHLVAAALTSTAADGPDGALALTLGAGSFRDGTRVAATRPELTAAMCAANAAVLADALDQLRGRLARVGDALAGEDPVAALLPILGAAQRIRAAWPVTAGERVTVPVEMAALLALGRDGGWITGIADDAGTLLAVRPRSAAEQ